MKELFTISFLIQKYPFLVFMTLTIIFVVSIILVVVRLGETLGEIIGDIIIQKINNNVMKRFDEVQDKIDDIEMNQNEVITILEERKR